MSIGERAYDILKKISFERMGGTEKEYEALTILKNEVDALGVVTEIEEFEIDDYEIEKIEFAVVEPNIGSLNVTAYGMCGSTAPEGLTADFVYVDNPKFISTMNLEGKIVLLSYGIAYSVYEDLVKAKVAAIISTSGTLYDDFSNTDLEERKLRERHYTLGKIPCVCIRMKDAEKLVLANPKKIHLTLIQKEGKKKSHNLVATIEGTNKPEEIICYTAHYDSVRFSTGAYDNGTGSVTILELLRFFASHKPNRTMKFIWCGSEEMGLLGSHAYVKQHEEELQKYLICINVDMTGIVLGKDIAVCTSELSLVQYIDYLGKISGFIIEASQGVYSSDSTPFAYHNVPAVSFARISSRGGAEIHSRKDILEMIQPQYLEQTILFINEFANILDTSVYFPVPKTMPANMKEDLDKYLGIKKNV